MILTITNKFFYCCFQLGRALKNFSRQPISELSFKFDQANGNNYRRIHSPYNGYQYFVTEKFIAGLKEHYAEYYHQELVDELFPQQQKDRILTKFHDLKTDYSRIAGKHRNGIKFKYSKYE